MKAPADDHQIAAALARNDRYVREFVEGFNLCPYARRCRETGKLHRQVLLDPGGPPDSPEFESVVHSLSIAIEKLEQLPPDAVEVGLILLPALHHALSQGMEGARGFEQMVRTVRERMQARHARGDTPFYCVAFHPGFAADLADEHRAVRFIRRSPDPTVQLVRASVLRAVRGNDPGGAHYIDISKMTTAELMAVSSPLSVSDRIGRANRRTLLDAGPESLSGLLAEIHGWHSAPKG